jgi:perosamine synthetase
MNNGPKGNPKLDYRSKFKLRRIKSWRFKGNEQRYVQDVLNSGFKAGSDGAYSSRFEKEFARKYGQKYGIAFNSGTTTLHTALLAIGCEPGDEVLVPSLTPLMCGLAIHYTGAIPAYVDVDLDTFLMDPEDLKSKITEKTKAILVVHMYGAVCDMKAIMEISNKFNLPVIEDCAQCHGGVAANGQLAGTLGLIGSWSFENSKHLTCGDGGIVTTNNDQLAEKIRKIGGLGFKTLTSESGKVRTEKDKLQNPNWERFDTIGFNYRMNQLAAAVALAQVERQEYFLSLRKLAGESYKKVIHGSEILIGQKAIDKTQPSYFTFSAKFEGNNHGISWERFRKQYINFGGDGIYAAAKLLYQEPAFADRNIGVHRTPKAETLQTKLMNFTTNQSSKKEIDKQLEILNRTLNYFGDK